MIRVKNPYKEPIATLFNYMEIIANPPDRSKAFSTTTETHLIDTIRTLDTGKWETGVRSNDRRWVIVQQYANRGKAKSGHNKWVSRIKINPTMELKDIYERSKVC